MVPWGYWWHRYVLRHPMAGPQEAGQVDIWHDEVCGRPFNMLARLPPDAAAAPNNVQQRSAMQQTRALDFMTAAIPNVPDGTGFIDSSNASTVGHVNDSARPVTMIVTQRVTAEQLHQLRGHPRMPIFISDGNDPQADSHGFGTHASRMVSTVSVHGGSSMGGRQMITVSFLDGSPDRVLEPDDEFDIHMLMLGPDLSPGEPLGEI